MVSCTYVYSDGGKSTEGSFDPFLIFFLYFPSIFSLCSSPRESQLGGAATANEGAMGTNMVSYACVCWRWRLVSIYVFFLFLLYFQVLRSPNRMEYTPQTVVGILYFIFIFIYLFSRVSIRWEVVFSIFHWFSLIFPIFSLVFLYFQFFVWET